MLLGIPTTSWFAAAGILLVALFLGLWQYFDQKSRVPDLFPDDRVFFAHQDRRRYVGIGVMGLLALLLLLLTSTEVQKRYILLAAIGLIVCVLIVVLLVLAFIDGLATRRYARRHGRELAQEHAKLMLDVIRRSAGSGAPRAVSDDKTKTSGI